MGTGEPSSTNQGAKLMPFQRWYPFKEAFSPSLVLDILKSTPYGVRSCLDPFGGSGTTSLTCQFQGITPYTVEINPFLADIIESKLKTYCPETLIEDYIQLLQSVDNAKIKGSTSAMPQTFREPGDNGRWIFSRSIFDQIQKYVEVIEGRCRPEHIPLFKTILGSCLIPVSNVRISGKGRRYRAQLSRATTNDLDNLFKKSFQTTIRDISAFSKPNKSYVLIRGDARTAIPRVEDLDLVITSPPYPNSFDYSDVYNVELWMLRYLQCKEDNYSLRTATLRSHVQIKRSFETRDWKSPTLQKTVAALVRSKKKLWNVNIPAMVGAYFDDLATVLMDCRASLRTKGRVVLAVGNSQYNNVEVDVATILVELAKGLGFRCVHNHAIRSMRVSAQQGGGRMLTESLLTLAKV
jgi:hypothetical protein